jgi:hypothetical protein
MREEARRRRVRMRSGRWEAWSIVFDVESLMRDAGYVIRDT